MFGIGILSGALYSTNHASGDFYQKFSDHYFLRDGFLESAFLAGFLFYLHRCGWKPSDFRFHRNWRTTLSGVGLFVLTVLSSFLVVHTAFHLARLLDGTVWGQFILIFLPVHYEVPHGALQLHWTTILAFTFLNAFYEEIVYLGYAFNQWAQKYGAGKAFLFTFALRMGVHIYQGSEHILQIGVLSLIFGLWYWRQGKLWPLVLGHALIDLMSLGLFKMDAAAHSQ